MVLPERPGRWHRLLSRLADIRPGETATATRLLLLFFFITFAAYIIKPVKEAALISAFHVGQLPYAYLLTAVVIGFVFHLNAHLLERLERRRYMSATFLFFCACLLVFWLCFFGYIRVPAKTLALAYWVWSDIFIAAAVSQFWIAVNDACHPHQAKRLVGLFVSGGLLGGIAAPSWRPAWRRKSAASTCSSSPPAFSSCPWSWSTSSTGSGDEGPPRRLRRARPWAIWRAFVWFAAAAISGSSPRSSPCP